MVLATFGGQEKMQLRLRPIEVLQMPSRRDFLKKAAYVAPVILTLDAVPAFAGSGSEPTSDRHRNQRGRGHSRHGRGRGRGHELR